LTAAGERGTSPKPSRAARWPPACIAVLGVRFLIVIGLLASPMLA
jgi:hypothetical protein